MEMLRTLLVVLVVASVVQGFNKGGNCKCGEKGNGRIVGGTAAALDEWPWQVALVYASSLFCGGSLINDRYVLTAAHCLDDDNPAGLRVWLSDYRLNTNADTPKVVRTVSQIKIHPNYVAGPEINDIALLKLTAPVTIKSHVLPVCLPPLRPLYINKQATVTGWGTTSSGGSISNVLREVTVPVVSNKYCKKRYGTSSIKNTMLCAGKTGKDSCQGDSGGPLVLLDGGGKYDLIGVVSWGAGCGDAGYPGVYTRVNKYLTWIDSNTKDGIYCKGF